MMIHRSITLGARTQRQQRRQLNRIFLFWRSILPLENRCPKSASLTSCAALPTYGLRDLRLLAVNGTITVDFPPLYLPPRTAALAWTSRQQQADTFHFVEAGLRVFSGIPPRADRSFFSGFVLALSGGTSFPGPPLSLDGEHSGPP